MAGTLPSSNKWEELYEQGIDGRVTSSIVATSGDSMSSSSSITATHQLSPKGCGSKPTRRRSRASKRTPTTLLNADATNFRALVQQFTGCPSANISFGSRKGPINLDFAKDHDNIATSMAPFGNRSYYDQQQSNAVQHLEQWPEQQRMASLYDLPNNGYFPAGSSDPSPGLQIPDEVFMGNMTFP